jgi:hypothetical protein
MITRDDNARSKELLLAALDKSIEEFIGEPTVRKSMIMNRNRIARFLGLHRTYQPPKEGE